MARATTSVLAVLVSCVAGSVVASTGPEAVSPGKAQGIALVAGSCPTFSWGSLEGARAYELVVYELEGEAVDGALPVLRARIPGTASSWTPSVGECFEPGRRYAWAVRAEGADTASAWSDARLFEVTAAPSVAEVEEALRVLERYLAFGRGESGGEGSAGEVREARAAPEALGSDALAPERAPAATSGDGVEIGTESITIAGQEVVTTATDRDTLGGMSCADGELAKWNASLSQWVCGDLSLHEHAGEAITSGVVAEPRIDPLVARDAEVFGLVTAGDGIGSGLDADLLDGQEASAFLTVGTDLWVDESGDTMTGTLTLTPASDLALSTAANVELGGRVLKGGTVFLHGGAFGNTALGKGSLSFVNPDELSTDGWFNTAVGALALEHNTVGWGNVAVGYRALRSAYHADSNTAVGSNALEGNSTGRNNTALGAGALKSNQGGDPLDSSDPRGSDNTAVGAGALRTNTIGHGNVAGGVQALSANTTGSLNTALGSRALEANTTGWKNTAVGGDALRSHTEGDFNSAFGRAALYSNIDGYYNTAIGDSALFNATGSDNIALGDTAGWNIAGGSHNIAIGSYGESDDAQTIRLGDSRHLRTFIAGIHGADVAGSPVVVDASGQLGVAAVATGDADTLDGVDSSQFLRSDEPDTMTETLTLTPSSGLALAVSPGHDIDLGGRVLKNGTVFLHDGGGGSNGNTALGRLSLASLVQGDYAVWNTAVGNQALRANTFGHFNTAVGTVALASNWIGYGNTALGASALNSNTSGSNNTAVGSGALTHNLGPETTGGEEGTRNTALGYVALGANTSGFQNTASGAWALSNNDTGSNNVAAGFAALRSNTSGHDNVATGVEGLFANTTGHDNTATGTRALAANVTGSYNTALGSDTLSDGSGSGGNVAVGWRALQYAERWNNTALGTQALRYSTGWDNIAIGNRAGINLRTDASSDNILVGNEGVDGDVNTIRIGNSGHARAFITGIHGVTLASGTTVFVTSDGQLGTMTSSARFKESIEDIGERSAVLSRLRPVRFRYREEIVGEAERPWVYGLVAEEVAEAFPDLVIYDEAGKPFTVRYHLLAPLLLNELQRQERLLGQQAEELGRLRHRLETIGTEADRLRGAGR